MLAIRYFLMERKNPLQPKHWWDTHLWIPCTSHDHTEQCFKEVKQDLIHPRKLTCPLKRDYFNRKCIFQPLVFRGHVSFPGSILTLVFSNFTFEVAFETGCVQGNPVSKWWNKYCNHDGTFNVTCCFAMSWFASTKEKAGIKLSELKAVNYRTWSGDILRLPVIMSVTFTTR